MTDLKKRLSRVEGFRPPDLWSEIQDRASTSGSQQEQVRLKESDAAAGDRVWRRRPPGVPMKLAAAAVALLLTAGSLYGLIVAFRGVPRDAATAPALNGPIGYAGQAAGSARGLDNLDIFTIDPMTGRSTDLTPTPHLSEDQPAWTLDGSKLAFVGSVGMPLTKTSSTSTSALYEMSADGTDLRKLPACSHDPCRIADPAWSPDGTRIAFVDSSVGQSLEIYDLRSGALSTICDDKRCGAGIAQPVWSPDGTRVAFSNFGLVARIGLFPPQSSIWVAAADGSFAKRLTPGQAVPGCVSQILFGCYSFDVSPVWSPDGSTIAFSRSQDKFAGVELIAANGGPVRPLASCTTDCGQNSVPVFSPDGSEVALVAGPLSIEIVKVQDQSARVIGTCLASGCVTLAAISWAPQGDALAFVGQSRKHSAIYVVTVGGQDLRKIADGWWNTLTWLPAAAA
jgi:Tol biopolymer transport system component